MRIVEGTVEDGALATAIDKIDEAAALVAKWRLTTLALSQIGLPLAAESVPELAEDLGRVLELLIGPYTAVASRQAP